MFGSKFSYILFGSRISLGDQVQVRHELIRSNKVVNHLNGLRRKGRELVVEMKLVVIRVPHWSEHMEKDVKIMVVLSTRSDLIAFKSRGRLLRI
jgi:hypothetical protein